MISNKIIITNIYNTTINYPVLLLKGKIIHNECLINDDTFTILLNKQKISSYRYCQNRFKILLELVKGENNIIVKYCCVIKELKINFSELNKTHKVIPLYIINKNNVGTFQTPKNVDNTKESAIKRIETIVKLLQSVIGEKLFQMGYNRITFESTDCQLFYSKLDVHQLIKMNQKDLWEYLGREIMQSPYGDNNKKYMGFLSCTKYKGNKNMKKYEDMIKMTEGYAAIGGGGLALCGTACMYTWPETISEVFDKFEDITEVDCDNFLNDSCYRNTLGACFSTTLGTVLHELCHTFNLGHTKDGIMGRGFDNIHKLFTDLTEEIPNVDNRFMGKLLPKHTNGIMRKSNSFHIKNFDLKITDDAYFTESCLALLYYHKFFSNYSTVGANVILTVDEITNIVKSTCGIRVIEIREKETELVLNSWVFSGKILKYSFQIPEDTKNRIIVVEDNIGNIINTNGT